MADQAEQMSALETMPDNAHGLSTWGYVYPDSGNDSGELSVYTTNNTTTEVRTATFNVQPESASLSSTVQVSLDGIENYISFAALISSSNTSFSPGTISFILQDVAEQTEGVTYTFAPDVSVAVTQYLTNEIDSELLDWIRLSGGATITLMIAPTTYTSGVWTYVEEIIVPAFTITVGDTIVVDDEFDVTYPSTGAKIYNVTVPNNEAIKIEILASYQYDRSQ